MAKNKCNQHRLFYPLCIVVTLILLFQIFRWIQNYRYTSEKMSYEALADFWEEGTYRRVAEFVPTKVYPQGWTERGTAVITRNDNAYDIDKTTNSVRSIPGKENIILDHRFLYNYSPFTKQVAMKHKNAVGSNADLAVSQINRNTIVAYTDSFDSESMGRENIPYILKVTKTKDGYRAEATYSPSYGLTWTPVYKATLTRQ